MHMAPWTQANHQIMSVLAPVAEASSLCHADFPYMAANGSFESSKSPATPLKKSPFEKGGFRRIWLLRSSLRLQELGNL